MKTIVNLLCATVLMSTLCAGFVACNEPKEHETGLGEEIPGKETFQISGTAIGTYTNGFATLVVQVDEEFPIGKPLDIPPGGYDHRSSIENDTDQVVTYSNAIQVQPHLPMMIGGKVYFSVREYQKDKDIDLFIVGSGLAFMDSAPPAVPIYVVTKLSSRIN